LHDSYLISAYFHSLSIENYAQMNQRGLEPTQQIQNDDKTKRKAPKINSGTFLSGIIWIRPWCLYTTNLEPILRKIAELQPRRLADKSARCAPPENPFALFFDFPRRDFLDLEKGVFWWVRCCFNRYLILQPAVSPFQSISHSLLAPN
jgi:hypothetical protein